MNILYIAPYRQSDRWGITSLQYLKALQTLDINLVSRPACFQTEYLINMPESIQKLERKKERRFDKIIQFAPPNLYEITDNTVGMCLVELRNMKYSQWHRFCNLTQKMIVGSKSERQSLIEYGEIKNCNVYVVQIPSEKPDKTYDKPKELCKFNDDTYFFYYIGEYNNARNLDALYTAFHREFNYRENVELIIQLQHIPGDGFADTLNNEILKLKQSLFLYSNHRMYKRENFIVGLLDENQRNAIHEHCHCYVNPTHTIESDIHLRQAMQYNNAFIHPLQMQKTIKSPALGMGCYGEWIELNIFELQKQMRKAFNEKWTSIASERMSYKNTGQQLLEAILND